MKSTVIGLASVLVFGFSTAALADDVSGPPCKKINAWSDISTLQFQVPCAKYPGFDWCYVGTTVKGSIKGTGDGYGDWEWFIPDIRAFGIPTWAAGASYQMNYEVLNTKHGDMYTEILTVADPRTPGAGMSLITGGTGIYEDATGFVVAWREDPASAFYKLRGEVCGPYIPIENDDDDSDGDD